MTEAAFGWLPRVEVSPVERDLGGLSLTLRTMRHLQAENPTWRLRFVLGSDLLASCKSWEGWEDIEKIAPPLPIGRAGISPVRADQPTPISPAVSSTIVRTALFKGDYNWAERYLPKNVLEYIRRHNLYSRGAFPEPLPPSTGKGVST